MSLTRDSIGRQATVQPHLHADRHRPADSGRTALVVAHGGPWIAPGQAQSPAKLCGVQRAAKAPERAQRLAGGVHIGTGHGLPIHRAVEGFVLSLESGVLALEQLHPAAHIDTSPGRPALLGHAPATANLRRQPLTESRTLGRGGARELNDLGGHRFVLRLGWGVAPSVRTNIQAFPVSTSGNVGDARIFSASATAKRRILSQLIERGKAEVQHG